MLLDKQSRKGKYTNTVNLARKYFGDFLIATYLNAVQESRYDDTYISGIEVCFSCEIVHSFAQ
jgi:preprotein translocase subunit SecA